MWPNIVKSVLTLGIFPLVKFIVNKRQKKREQEIRLTEAKAKLEEAKNKKGKK